MKVKMLNVRLSVLQKEKLVKVAAARQMSVSELITDLIKGLPDIK
jgi:hypothetical protein